MSILNTLISKVEGAAPSSGHISNHVKSILDPIFMILLAVMCIAIIVVILMQKSKESGISALSGGSIDTDSFYGKNKSSTKESKLKKVTIALIVFIVIVSILFFIIQIV